MIPDPAQVYAEARRCALCASFFGHAPRPVFRASPSARLLIVGQAPGRKVHETGLPWNDLSGDRLRTWLNLSREAFYDESRIAIIPIGLCYPGKGPGGDLPPRPECAPRWHPVLRTTLPNIRLTLLIGGYAQAFYLKERQGKNLAETVRQGTLYLPEYFPLPHPSPRNLRWFKTHPWFETEVLPRLREWVGRILG